MKPKKKDIQAKGTKALSFLAQHQNVILGGALVLGGLFIIYKLVKVFTPDKIDNQVKNTGGGIDKKKTTITKEQATNFAQILLDAMNYNPAWLVYGTDEEAILNVFKKIQNGHDFLLVYHAFGNKDYNGFNSPPKGPMRFLDVYQPRNLVYWLKSELSPRDGEVYHLVKKRVEEAGFTF